MMGRKINVGCGEFLKPGYINIDKVAVFNPDIVRDVRYGLPFDDSSVDEVLASHFCEHLTTEELFAFMRESFRVLRSGGILRIVVPIGAEALGYIDHKKRFEEFTFTNFFRDAPLYYGITDKIEPAGKEVYVDAVGAKVLDFSIRVDKGVTK